MTININKEVKEDFSFDYEELITAVVNEAVDYVKCPYECFLEIDIVYNNDIKELNREFRGIDNPTDVLSFPLLEYEEPGNFEFLEDSEEYLYFEPETGELVLGNIVLSYDKILSQAEEYGHEIKREMAFLVAHSMLHLFGYDLMEDNERAVMEKMQEEILQKLNISR